MWLAAVVLSVDQLIAWGVLYYAYVVFSVPLAAELGVSQQAIAGAFSVSLLISGALALRVGRALDRHGSYVALIGGAAIGAVALVLIASARGCFVLLMGFIVLGVAQALSLYEPAFRAVVGWFDDERARGRALLVITMLGGFASTVFLPVTTLLTDRLGWRTALYVLSAIVCLVLIPIRATLPRAFNARAPAHRDARETAHASVRWLAAAFSVQAFVSTAVVLELLWFLVEQGRTQTAAALHAGFAGAAQVPGRLLFGFIKRSVDTRRRLPLLFMSQAIALLMMLAGRGAVSTAGILVFGATSGMMTLERATVVLEWYERQAFGSESGRISGVSNMAKAAAPFAVVTIHQTMSYAGAFVALAITLMFGAACVVVADRRRSQESDSVQPLVQEL